VGNEDIKWVDAVCWATELFILRKLLSVAWGVTSIVPNNNIYRNKFWTLPCNIFHYHIVTIILSGGSLDLVIRKIQLWDPYKVLESYFHLIKERQLSFAFSWRTNATEKKDLVMSDVPMWWKSSCELQGMYGLYRPTKENIPTSPVETTPPTQIRQTLYTQPGVTYAQIKKTPWSESASELHRPSERRLLAKWFPTFADRGCHVVSVTDPYGRILGYLDRSRYFSI
jgi:hypothetical protein